MIGNRTVAEGVAMAVQRSISRSVQVPVAPSRAWAALSDPECLGRWLGVEIAVDLRPGGVGLAGERLLQVEQVVAPERLVFAWWPLRADGEPASRVELQLEPTPGGTRVTAVETVLADLPADAPAGLAAAR